MSIQCPFLFPPFFLPSQRNFPISFKPKVAIARLQWKMQEKTWYYEKWGGRHVSFPPRRSVNMIVWEFFIEKADGSRIQKKSKKKWTGELLVQKWCSTILRYKVCIASGHIIENSYIRWTAIKEFSSAPVHLKIP